MLTPSPQSIIMGIGSNGFLQFPFFKNKEKTSVMALESFYGLFEGSSWFGAFNSCCNLAAAGNEAKSIERIKQKKIKNKLLRINKFSN